MAKSSPKSNPVAPSTTDNDRIEREHIAAERTYYDPRADFLVQCALDEQTHPRAAKRAMKRASEIFYTARVVVRAGAINVRQNVINVLRRIGA